jgi:hypothetical protein
MSRLVHRAAQFLLIIFFFGWITYPGWFCEWYSNYPENYAFPASMSNDHDPRWGFWFW